MRKILQIISSLLCLSQLICSCGIKESDSEDKDSTVLENDESTVQTTQVESISPDVEAVVAQIVYGMTYPDVCKILGEGLGL